MKHPLGSLGLKEIKDWAKELSKQVVDNLTSPEKILNHDNKNELSDSGEVVDNGKIAWIDKVVQAPILLEKINEMFYENKWTDGLPFVPPTVTRVKKMIEGIHKDPDEVVATVPPSWGKATIAKIGANAVMAGCKPGYMPILIAAVQAMCEPEFNLNALQTTTNPCAPLMIVNGPIRNELKINYEAGAFGPGWQANATIGRAVRLILMNIGGAHPGELDKATHGQPGKYSFCIAENEEDSPWDSYHAEKGYAVDTNTVTMVNATGLFSMVDSASTTAKSLLTMLVGGMTGLGTLNLYKGGDPLLILSPEHANILAQEGLTKNKIKEYIYTHAYVPINKFPKEVKEKYIKIRRPDLFQKGPDDSVIVTIADNPGAITIIVCGGPGRHSVYVPTFVNGCTITKAIKID